MGASCGLGFPNYHGQRRITKRANQAAELLDRSRSDFMLEVACREAEAVLLARNHFSLSEDRYQRFRAMLDQPPNDNAKLRKLLESKAPWDR
jgi:uncharacterized protein (DUF1778 family)